MKSCLQMLFWGVVAIFFFLAVGDPDAAGIYVPVVIALAVIGWVVVKANSSKKNKNLVGRHIAQNRPPSQSGHPSTPGWTLVPRDDSVAQLWVGNPHLPSTQVHNVRQGRAHKRAVTVFQFSGAITAPAFMVFRMPSYLGPDFTASSDGRNEVSVQGQIPDGLNPVLSAIGPRNFRRLGFANRLFWMEIGPMTASQSGTFVVSRAPAIVMAVNDHLGSSIDAVAQQDPAVAGQVRKLQRPGQRPARQQAGRAPQRPKQQPRPLTSSLRSTPLPHDLGPDPSEILQTGPIEQIQRPALKPAAPDPVSRSLGNPTLTTGWKPVDWQPTTFELTAPMGLGETPSARDSLSAGWKPREWTPPEYGTSAAGEWKPADAWQPNYTRLGDDQ